MLKKEEQTITENIPFFPLGIVVLPGETRFLHVFETKYRNLFEDIGKSSNRFGIPFMTRGNLFDVGSLVKVEKVLARYPNGEIDVAVKGVDFFSITRLKAEHPKRLYPYGDIFLLKKDSVRISRPAVSLFEKYCENVLKIDLKTFPQLSFYIIANSIGLTDLEKYEIMIQKDAKEMNRILSNHLRLRTILANQHSSLHEYYSLN